MSLEESSSEVLQSEEVDINDSATAAAVVVGLIPPATPHRVVNDFALEMAKDIIQDEVIKSKLAERIKSKLAERIKCATDQREPLEANSGKMPVSNDIPLSFKLSKMGGLSKQKAYLKEAIRLRLTQADPPEDLGLSSSRGVLLHGPPGTGKTYTVKAIYNALKKKDPATSFFYLRGADVFSLFQGESEKNIIALFEAAKKNQPSVLFFDELDALCPSSVSGYEDSASGEAHHSVVACLLKELDALENENIFVIGAVNQLEAVDHAARDLGRFDKPLAFGLPDEEGRREIIKIHTRSWTEAEDRPGEKLLGELVERTSGFSGADIEQLCRDVAFVFLHINANKEAGCLNADCKDAKITKDYWIQALRDMSRLRPAATSADFATSLMIPKKPVKMISDLIRPLVQQVIQQLRPALEASSSSSDANAMHSALFFQEKTKCETFMNTYILQGILCDQLFNGATIFEISPFIITNKVLSGAQATLLHAVDDIVNEALQAGSIHNRVTIAAVHNINQILELSDVNRIPVEEVLNILSRVKGPNMFLLATSSTPPADYLNDEWTKILFNSEHHDHPAVIQELRNTSSERDLQQFFVDVFTEKRRTDGGSWSDRMMDVLYKIMERTAKLVHFHEFTKILSFANALSRVDLTRADSEQAEQELEEILRKYQSTIPSSP